MVINASSLFAVVLVATLLLPAGPLARPAGADPNTDYAASLQAFRAELARIGTFLAYFDQINRIAVALGQQRPADADAALRARTAAVYGRTYTPAEFDQLVAQHRQASGAFFARVEQEVLASTRWPGNRPPEVARPAAKALLDRSRRQYEAAVGARQDPLVALQGAVSVRGFAMGSETPPALIDVFAGQWERITGAMPSPTSRDTVGQMVSSTREAAAASAPAPPTGAPAASPPAATGARPIPGEMTRPATPPPTVTAPVAPATPVTPPVVSPSVTAPPPSVAAPSPAVTVPSPPATALPPGTTTNPRDPIARGNALLNEGRYREALATFDEALRAPNPPVDAWIGRGRALNVLGDMVGARRAYETAIQLDPSRQLVRTWLAEVTLAANDLGAAEAALGEELRRYPSSSAWAYSWIGTIRMLQGRDPESMQAMATAMRLDPQTASYRYSNGSFLSGVGQSQRAVVELLSTLRLDQSIAGVWYGLGLEYARQGRTNEAIQAYETYLQRDATSQWAQQARQEVARLRGQAAAPAPGVLPGATMTCPPGTLMVAGACLQVPTR